MQESYKDRILKENERQEVVEALEAILATDKFEAAPQMSAFLRYVVEQAADGNQNRIKAFTVAVDALGKPDSFDPQNDPVVRVLAGRLRAALAAYNDENPDALVVITMTPGSYVPSFKRKNARSSEALQLQSVLEDTEHEPQSSHTVNAQRKVATTAPGKVEEPSPACEPEQTVAPEVKYVHGPDAPDTDHERVKSPSSMLASASEALGKIPRLAVAAAIAAVIAFGLLQERIEVNGEPEILAATQAGKLGRNLSSRGRPNEPAVFISAIDYGNELENSLNTLVSGVISESEHVRVYRILDTEQDIRFWSEDYILTLTAVNAPDQTQINMQLTEARTGRFVHSEVAQLDKQATTHLTLDELERITATARSLVDLDGPVIKDYSLRHDTD